MIVPVFLGRMLRKLNFEVVDLKIVCVYALGSHPNQMDTERTLEDRLLYIIIRVGCCNSVHDKAWVVHCGFSEKFAVLHGLFSSKLAGLSKGLLIEALLLVVGDEGDEDNDHDADIKDAGNDKDDAEDTLEDLAASEEVNDRDDTDSTVAGDANDVEDKESEVEEVNTKSAEESHGLAGHEGVVVWEVADFEADWPQSDEVESAENEHHSGAVVENITTAHREEHGKQVDEVDWAEEKKGHEHGLGGLPGLEWEILIWVIGPPVEHWWEVLAAVCGTDGTIGKSLFALADDAFPLLELAFAISNLLFGNWHSGNWINKFWLAGDRGESIRDGFGDG